MMMMASSVVVGPLGNYLVPLMIGSRRTAFPRVEAASFWLFVAGYFVILTALPLGGFPTGWTGYAPLQTQGAGGMDSYLVGFGGDRHGHDPGRVQPGGHHHPLPGPGNDLGTDPHLRVVDPGHLRPADPGHSDAGGRRAVRRPRPHGPDRLLRQRARGQLVLCGRTSSGSSVTPRCTSWPCPVSGSWRRYSPCSAANRSSATGRRRPA